MVLGNPLHSADDVTTLESGEHGPASFIAHLPGSAQPKSIQSNRGGSTNRSVLIYSSCHCRV